MKASSQQQPTISGAMHDSEGIPASAFLVYHFGHVKLPQVITSWQQRAVHLSGEHSVEFARPAIGTWFSGHEYSPQASAVVVVVVLVVDVVVVVTL
jgi:hypothetical protein